MRGPFLFVAPLALLALLVVATRLASAELEDRGDEDRGVVDAGVFPTPAELLARARVELARPTPTRADSANSGRPDGGEGSARLAQVAGWLRQASVLAPRDFGVHLMLAEVLLRQGHPADAVSAFQRACLFARGPGQVFPCSLRLAEARARDGQYEGALGEYNRHLDIGNRTKEPDLFVRRAEVMMAMGKLVDAESSFATAIALLRRASMPQEHETATLARALFGQAVVMDRDGRDREARQTVWRAIALDPTLSVLEVCDSAVGESTDRVANLPFLPVGEVDYYRGLAQLVLGESRLAMEAFNRFVASGRQSPWRERAEQHLLALAAAGADVPSESARRGTVVAAATLEAHGPLPAPLIDAAWRSRPRLLEPCMAEVPRHVTRVLRLPLLLEIDGKGIPRRVQVQVGAAGDFGLAGDWRVFTTCVEKRVLAGLRTVVPGNMRRTSVRIELVVAIDARP